MCSWQRTEGASAGTSVSADILQRMGWKRGTAGEMSNDKGGTVTVTWQTWLTTMKYMLM